MGCHSLLQGIFPTRGSYTGLVHCRWILYQWATREAFSSPAAAAAKSLQSSLTQCNPIDGSPPGSPVPGILQARTLEWVAISFSNAWKWNVKVKSLSRVWLLVISWTAAHQAPLSMGFSKSTAVEMQNLNHWTTRKSLVEPSFKSFTLVVSWRKKKKKRI